MKKYLSSNPQTAHYKQWIMTKNQLKTNINIQKLSSKWNNSFILEPYPWQVDIISSIISYRASVNHINQLCICSNGGGKILIFNTVNYFLKGTDLCISPLVLLSDGKMRKVIANTVLYKIITLFHVDEMGSAIITF